MVNRLCNILLCGLFIFQQSACSTSKEFIRYAERNETSNVKTYITNHNKVNINEKDGNNETALMKAARNGNIEMVKFLIQNGANIDVRKTRIISTWSGNRGWDGVAISFLTVISIGIALIFIIPGFHQEEIGDKNTTALSIAIESQQYETAQFLLSLKAKKEGIAPVHFVTDDAFLKYIVKHGMNINAPDKEGLTVYDNAWLNSHNYEQDIERLRFLKQLGAHGPSQKAMLLVQKTERERKQDERNRQLKDIKESQERENQQVACTKMVYNHPTTSNTCSEICNTYFPNDRDCKSTCCGCWKLLSRPGDLPCR